MSVLAALWTLFCQLLGAEMAIVHRQFRTSLFGFFAFFGQKQILIAVYSMNETEVELIAGLNGGEDTAGQRLMNDYLEFGR